MGLCLGCELPTQVLEPERRETGSKDDSHLRRSRLTQIRNAEYHVPPRLQGMIVAGCERVMKNTKKGSQTV